MSFSTCTLHRQTVSDPQVIDKAAVAFSFWLSALCISPLSRDGGSCRNLLVCNCLDTRTLCNCKLAPVYDLKAGHSPLKEKKWMLPQAVYCSALVGRYKGSPQKPSITGVAAPCKHNAVNGRRYVLVNTNRKASAASWPRLPAGSLLICFALV